MLSMSGLVPPPMCFDAACQAAADRTFLLVISLPVLGLVAWLRFLLRPVPKELKVRTGNWEVVESDVAELIAASRVLLHPIVPQAPISQR